MTLPTHPFVDADFVAPETPAAGPVAITGTAPAEIVDAAAQTKAVVAVVLAFVPFAVAYLVVGFVAAMWWGGAMAWRDLKWRITGE